MFLGAFNLFGKHLPGAQISVLVSSWLFVQGCLVHLLHVCASCERTCCCLDILTFIFLAAITFIGGSGRNKCSKHHGSEVSQQRDS